MTCVGRYSVERVLEVAGPRDAYAIRFGDRLARADVPRFKLTARSATGPLLVEVLEQTDEMLITELDEGPPTAPLSLEEVVTLLRPIASALAELHRGGYVHGALSLAAIARMGSAIKLRDTGFGGWLAEGALDDARPEWFEHVAPEQLAVDPPTTASDIWAFGTVAFRLLTGQPFFTEGSVTERARRLLIDPVPTVTERAAALAVQVPPQLVDFFNGCIARDKTARFASIEEAFDALAGTLNRERILERRRRYIEAAEHDEQRKVGVPEVCLSVGYVQLERHGSPARPPRHRALYIVLLVAIVAVAALAWRAFTRG